MKKRGQIWVETVIYTLIALVMIGLVLTFIKPKITELQDKTILQQSISVLDNINNVILSLSEAGPGNKREITIGLKAGSLTIDGINNEIIFKMDSQYQFSEPGKNVNYGDLLVYTQKTGSTNTVSMTLNYSNNYNLTYNEKDTTKQISKSSTPYNIFISNNGGSPLNINFELG